MIKHLALVAALIALATPASAADIIWACETTIVSVDVEYEASSMGGENEQWIVTYQFERPPSGKFIFKIYQDAEGPAFWSAELNGTKCERGSFMTTAPHAPNP